MATTPTAPNASATIPVPSASPAATRARASGVDTGLYYYGARYYDPEVARFIQADSTVPDPEFSQAYNRYAYVYNNPLKFSDPTGQCPWAIAAAIMKVASIFNTMKAVCVAVNTGNYMGLAIDLTCSIVGGTIGAEIGGAIGGALGEALGGALRISPTCPQVIC